MNKLLYNLYYKKTDKLGRSRETHHLGVFDDVDKLDAFKLKFSESTPGAIFEVHTIEHLFFEQRPT